MVQADTGDVCEFAGEPGAGHGECRRIESGPVSVGGVGAGEVDIGVGLACGEQVGADIVGGPVDGG